MAYSELTNFKCLHNIWNNNERPQGFSFLDNSGFIRYSVPHDSSWLINNHYIFENDAVLMYASINYYTILTVHFKKLGITLLYRPNYNEFNNLIFEEFKTPGVYGVSVLTPSKNSVCRV